VIKDGSYGEEVAFGDGNGQWKGGPFQCCLLVQGQGSSLFSPFLEGVLKL